LSQLCYSFFLGKILLYMLHSVTVSCTMSNQSHWSLYLWIHGAILAPTGS